MGALEKLKREQLQNMNIANHLPCMGATNSTANISVGITRIRIVSLQQIVLLEKTKIEA
jgi:hypothetical protein